MNIRMAVDSVKQHLQYLSDLGPRGEPRLEEFDVDDDLGIWTLTLSFDDPFGAQRIYRVFQVNSEGDVVSMKIARVGEPEHL